MARAVSVKPAGKRQKHAIAVAPSAIAYVNLADALVDTGRWPEAAELGERAVRLKPDVALAHNPVWRGRRSATTPARSARSARPRA